MGRYCEGSAFVPSPKEKKKVCDLGLATPLKYRTPSAPVTFCPWYRHPSLGPDSFPVAKPPSNKSKMLWTTLLFAALAEAQGGRSTMLRFGCSQLVIDRIDPLVNPGQLPSPHLHQVVGGNAFNVTVPNADIGELATCTTCSYSEDLSNYWTANLYFKARNGSYKRVPQIPNRYGIQGFATGMERQC